MAIRIPISLAAALLFVAVTIAGCPNPPPPVPPPPGYDGGEELDASRATCGRACENLAHLGCAIGDCEVACQKSQGTVTDLHPACLAKAQTKEEARACGSVKCP